MPTIIFKDAMKINLPFSLFTVQSVNKQEASENSDSLRIATGFYVRQIYKANISTQITIEARIEIFAWYYMI